MANKLRKSFYHLIVKLIPIKTGVNRISEWLEVSAFSEDIESEFQRRTELGNIQKLYCRVADTCFNV